MTNETYSLKVTDAARLLGVHPGTVRHWCDDGVLPHARTPGGQRRFNAAELDAFIAKSRVIADVDLLIANSEVLK